MTGINGRRGSGAYAEGRRAAPDGEATKPRQGGRREALLAEKRARLEERLEVLRRQLSGLRLDGLTDKETAAIGQRFAIRVEDGAVESWELASPDEANPRAGLVSVRSPLGQALLGKTPGEVAEVKTPAEVYAVVVLSVTSPEEGTTRAA
jgi:transcription elongation GreA/GreB family factor